MIKKARKKSIKARLESRLHQLKTEFSVTEKESTKNKLAYQIKKTENELEIERIHKISKFRTIKARIILSGAIGLGKKK